MEHFRTIDVDVSGAMRETVMTVRIRPSRVWLLKLRTRVACWIFRLGAFVLGVGNFHVEMDPLSQSNGK